MVIKNTKASSGLIGQPFSTAAKQWKPPPHINQLRPNGATASYANGAYNCGPTVVAMLARSWGRMNHLGDAELIQTLGSRHVGKDGTTPEAMMRMLRRANIPLGGAALGAGFSHQALGQRLRSGEQFIAQVGTTDPKTGKVSSHYVLIREQRRDGSYLISDPLSDKPQVVTQEQLKQAVLRAPPDGGVLIPIASPFQQEQDLERGGSSGTSKRIASNLAAGMGRGKLASTAQGPDAAAFQCSDDVFQNVDTRFQDVQNSPDVDATFDVMERMSSRHTPRVSYSDGNEPLLRRPRNQAITPAHLSVDEFATQLRQDRARGAPETYELLRQLALSGNERDQQVLAALEAQDLKDPGIGKKTTTEF